SDQRNLNTFADNMNNPGHSALPIDEQTTSAAWPCPPPISVFVRDNAGATWHDWLNMLDALEAGLQEMDYKDENWKKTQANLKRARTLYDVFQAELAKNEKCIEKIFSAHGSMANAQDTGFQVQQNLVQKLLGKRSANVLDGNRGLLQISTACAGLGEAAQAAAGDQRAGDPCAVTHAAHQTNAAYPGDAALFRRRTPGSHPRDRAGNSGLPAPSSLARPRSLDAKRLQAGSSIGEI
ncbi:7189_t:CDS:2, partial [Paraglomus brasilianum]